MKDKNRRDVKTILYPLIPTEEIERSHGRDLRWSKPTKLLRSSVSFIKILDENRSQSSTRHRLQPEREFRRISYSCTHLAQKLFLRIQADGRAVFGNLLFYLPMARDFYAFYKSMRQIYIYTSQTKYGSSKTNGPYICPERLAHVRFSVRVRVRAGIILGNKRLQAWSVLFTWSLALSYLSE